MPLTPRAACVVACVVALAGCGDAGRPDVASGGPSLLPAPAPPAPGTSQSAGRPVCAPEGAVRYHAFLEYGACCDVVTPGGTWVGRTLFPDAPKDVSDIACTYWWSPAKPTSVPEINALRALSPLHLTLNTQTMPRCDPPTARGTATLAAPRRSIGPPTGVVGCDVCGRLGDGTEVFAILPADGAKTWTFVADTSDGRTLAFDVTPPEHAKQAFSVELPRDRAGTTYKRGSISVFRAE